MKEKLNIDDIIKRFNIYHNNYYTYNITKYKSTTDTIVILCPKHGEFKQTIANHFKHGCYECAKIKLANIKRGNIETYINKCNIIYNNKYDYSKVIFNKLKDKVEIICTEHGSFFVSLDNHMNKKIGCKKCTIHKSGKFKPKEIMYDYSKVKYINSKTKIEIICPIHGSFFQTPNNHLSKNHKCPSCSLISKSNLFISNLDNYLNKLNSFHSYKYDYSKFVYMGYNKKSIIICQIHGEFKQSISSNLKYGCPFCNESKGEKEISKILDMNNIKYERQKKFTECKNIRKLSFDFYLPNYNN